MTNLLALWYKERDSPIIHVNEVSKNVGEQRRLQILFDTFTGQETRWWGTQQSRLQTWTTTSTYFIDIFGGKKLIVESHIKKFSPHNDPKEHIDSCEKE